MVQSDRILLGSNPYQRNESYCVEHRQRHDLHYNIDGSGMLTLANAVAAHLGPTSAPRDMALSVNGQILFVQTEGGQSVAVFHTEVLPQNRQVGICIADAIRPRATTAVPAS